MGCQKPFLYWRGATSGGILSSSSSNYHNFSRFHLIDIGRARPDIIDAALTRLSVQNCDAVKGDCDDRSIKSEYGIHSKGVPREGSYAFKYLFDVDGNSFSGRYLGLLGTGSLVFKSTVFDEYFNGWLRPFEHYIPILPDLSDLVTQVEWAISHDEEAQKIQRAGKEMVERVITDAQNDCYYFAVLLEYARLQKGL